MENIEIQEYIEIQKYIENIQKKTQKKYRNIENIEKYKKDIGRKSVGQTRKIWKHIENLQNTQSDILEKYRKIQKRIEKY